MNQTYTYSLDAPIEEVPANVISLVPALTESLFDLNLGSKLIGRTYECLLPEVAVDTIPIIGSVKRVDVERVVQLSPSLVLANYEENRREDVEALQRAGIPVWVTYPRTVQDVLNLLWNLMYLFDETSMVARVHLIEQIYDRLLNLNEGREDQLPRVFVPIAQDPLITANHNAYLHDVLYICGGKNIFADIISGQQGESNYPQVTVEAVEQAQPDIILLPTGELFPFTRQHLEVFKQLDVPATRNNRVLLVDGRLLTWHGTRVAYAFDQLPLLLRLG
jgi:ABC-type Fe3+-hydroxamate transport system substrate-binding protein